MIKIGNGFLYIGSDQMDKEEYLAAMKKYRDWFHLHDYMVISKEIRDNGIHILAKHMMTGRNESFLATEFALKYFKHTSDRKHPWSWEIVCYGKSMRDAMEQAING